MPMKRLFTSSFTFLSCCLLVLTAAAQTAPDVGIDYKSEQPVRTRHAMVVTVHHDATDAGVEILKQGGNAVDAAVAVGFALAVVHPEAGNIGGGGFMLVRFKNGKSHFMDYREEAPGAATMNMYLDAQGNVIPDASTVGYRSIGVPGSVAGMVRAEKLWGKLTLAQVMQPAIRLARNGFVLSEEEAEEMHDPLLTKFPASRHIFQRDGDFYRAGETFRQPELAATLERIAKNPRDFYHGAMAAQIAAAIQKGGGLITAKDLAAYRAKDRRPLVGEYQGYKILTAPPPSGGGIGSAGDAEHSRALRSDWVGRSFAARDALYSGGFSPRLHGPHGLPGRSRLYADPCKADDQPEIRGSVSRQHFAGQGHALEHAEAASRISAASAPAGAAAS